MERGASILWEQTSFANFGDDLDTIALIKLRIRSPHAGACSHAIRRAKEENICQKKLKN
jgi:hypothetical protein